MKVLFIGDVYGTRGMEALELYVPKLKKEHNINMVFLNGENLDKGRGITEQNYKDVMKLGVQGITLGNHSFDNKQVFNFIETSNIIRPLNYPKTVLGNGYKVFKFNTTTICVISIMGRVFMGDPLNNPFDALDEALTEIEADYIIVDVHAEATSEKLAIAHYLDGRVHAIVGTHTHVQTSDNMLLPKGSLYITDIGMTGALYGILGSDKDIQLRKFITGVREYNKESLSHELQFNAVVLDFDKNTIERISLVKK